MAGPRPSFRAALDVLARHRVDFVVVGGVAAVLNGAPISTFDLDIVHARAEAKEETARDKDRAVLAILRRALAERTTT